MQTKAGAWVQQHSKEQCKATWTGTETAQRLPAGSKRLSFSMKQKLWTLAFVLASLRTCSNFFHGGTEGDGTLETQGQISTQINHLATPRSPVVCGFLEYFACDLTEELDSHG